VVIGTGFTVPPHHTATFPALRPDTASFRTEQAVLKTVNAVLGARAAPGLSTLPALLETPVRIVNSIPLLDPYAPLRLDPYLQIRTPQSALPATPNGGVFAFIDMRGKEAANAVEALAYLCRDAVVEAHLRGPGAPAAMAMLKRRGAVVHASPPPMHEALSRANAVLSQGGHGVSWATAAAGRGHVVMPVHFEAMLNGVALERAGIGKVAWGGTVDTILDQVSWALDAGLASATAHAATLPSPPLALAEQILDALGFKTQRRGKPASSSANPKRGQKRQGSSTGGRASSR
jgi:hypothetical protein